MAARLNLIGAHVTTADGDHAGVQIVVRANVATVSNPKGALVEKPGVIAVMETGPRARTVRFEDGQEWAVVLPERKKGCGCK